MLYPELLQTGVTKAMTKSDAAEDPRSQEDFPKQRSRTRPHPDMSCQPPSVKINVALMGVYQGVRPMLLMHVQHVPWVLS